MQQKTPKIIKLANRSRKNRMFYDNLIRELAICLNTGDREINRDLLTPIYVNHAHSRKIACAENYIQISRDDGCQFLPLGEVLPSSLLDEIDRMLASAPLELKHCNSKATIADYLMRCTDFTDCHLTAMNEMQSLNPKLIVTKQY